MTARVEAVERRVRGGVPSLGDHGLDVLFAHEVLDRRHESRARRPDHAVGRPGVDEVRMVRDVFGCILVVVARGDHELVFVLEMAEVAGDQRGHRQPTRDAEAAALDEVRLHVDHQQRVDHASIRDLS